MFGIRGAILYSENFRLESERTAEARPTMRSLTPPPMPARLPRAPATVPIPNAVGSTLGSSGGTIDCLDSLALALAWLLDDEHVAHCRHLLLTARRRAVAGRRWVASRQIPHETRDGARGDATERIIVLSLLRVLCSTVSSGAVGAERCDGKL